jgi:hypothetical protein
MSSGWADASSAAPATKYDGILIRVEWDKFIVRRFAVTFSLL